MVLAVLGGVLVAAGWVSDGTAAVGTSPRTGMELATPMLSARRVPDLATALVAAQALLTDAPVLTAMRQAAQDFTIGHRGSAERTAAAVGIRPREATRAGPAQPREHRAQHREPTCVQLVERLAGRERELGGRPRRASVQRRPREPPGFGWLHRR